MCEKRSHQSNLWDKAEKEQASQILSIKARTEDNGGKRLELREWNKCVTQKSRNETLQVLWCRERAMVVGGNRRIWGFGWGSLV
jgi:hypothetical protein